MRLVIFGGATEGRELSRRLAGLGAQVEVYVATEYGEQEQGRTPGVRVHTGRLGEEELAAAVAGCALCVDATHPYAARITAGLRRACARTGTPYRRLLREESELPPGSLPVEDADRAAALLAQTEGNILLATGAKELPAFIPLGGERLFPRILPTVQGLEACRAAGIPRRNIIAMQGPFTRQMNQAILEQFRIKWLVTKDGGAPGGFREKAEAALACGAGLVVIRRPADRGESFEELERQCRALIQGSAAAESGGEESWK